MYFIEVCHALICSLSKPAATRSKGSQLGIVGFFPSRLEILTLVYIDY